MNEMLIPKVGPVAPREEISSPRQIDAKKTGPTEFDSLLEGRLRDPLKTPASSAALSASSLKFSAHALSRLKDRSISLGQDLLSKLEKAVDTAAQKGAKESLVLSSDAAFIVSVKNKTVITVVDRNQMSGNVFTNIDSTVVI